MGVEVVGSVVREGVEDGVEVVQYGHFQGGVLMRLDAELRKAVLYIKGLTTGAERAPLMFPPAAGVDMTFIRSLGECGFPRGTEVETFWL